MTALMPQVSVVMSVFDSPDDVRTTMESVLAQKDVELDFVIISDGAEKSVVDVVKGFSDSRIRFFEQSNQGLTKALIWGCREARYEAIARVDAGDVMLPSRLNKQADQLYESTSIALVACWVRVCTIKGEWLYDVKQSGSELRRGISSLTLENLVSPVHASVMFRKSVYEAVGGYRWQFYFTQDCDLWPRLTQNHEIRTVPEVLQEIVFSPSGLSGKYRNYQTKLSALVVEANNLRTERKSESEMLERASDIRPHSHQESDSFDEYEGYYFIASVLEKNRDIESAVDYWRSALSIRPYNIKARLRLYIAKIRRCLLLSQP